MNWATLVLTVIDIILAIVIAKSVCCSNRMLEVGSLGLSFFFSLYVVLSGIFFWADLFTFCRVLFFQGVLQVVYLVIYILKNRKLVYEVGVRKIEIDAVPLIVAILALMLTFVKFELYHTGQDQGLYQAEAIAIACGDYHIQHDFNEYEMLDNVVERVEYAQMVKQWPGYYRLFQATDYPTVDEKDVLSRVSGSYHGIITWPAVMALFGKLFGLQNMFYIQSVFLACTVILLYYALEHLGIRKKINLCVLLIFVFSPLVIWVSKSAMTEMFLTFVMTLYLYIFVSENIKKVYLSVPLAAFSFFHISFLIIIPPIFVAHILAYVVKKDHSYLLANAFLAVSIAVGYAMMIFTAPKYAYGNLRRLFIGPISANNIYYFIILGCLGITVVSIIARRERFQQIVRKAIRWKYLSTFLSASTFVFIVYMLFTAYKNGFIVNPDAGWNAAICQYYGTGVIAFTKLTLFAFIMATGFIVIPLIIYTAIAKNWFLTNEAIGKKNGLVPFVLLLLFYYMVIFQSAFIRKEVYFYYYYSRYLVFYIPLICILAAICMNNFKRIVAYGITVGSVALMLIFDQAILINKDDTCFEWETLFDIDTVVENDSAIIIGTKNLQFTIGPDLKAITSADIYPVFKDYENEIKELSLKYSHVYYLTDDLVSADSGMDKVLSYGGTDFIQTYRDTYTFSLGGDDPMYPTYPLEIEPVKRQIALYTYSTGIDSNISVVDPVVGVSEGKKYDNYIESTGNQGTVVYGPYISLSAGMYELNVPIQFLQSMSDDSVSYMVYSNGNTTYASGNISDVLQSTDEGSIASIPFTLFEDTDNVEFVFSEQEGTIVRIYDYYLNKLDEKKPAVKFNIVEDSRIGVLNGSFENDYIQSDGNEGTVIYGPYISLPKGEYQVSFPIKILKGEASDYSFNVSTYNKQNGETIVLSEGSFKDVIENNDVETIINIPFSLEKKTDNIEFIIKEKKNTRINIYNYTLSQTTRFSDGYEDEDYDTIINATDDYQIGPGWSPVNDAGYRWMNSDEADVFVDLDMGNTYEMSVFNGDTIPFTNIKAEHIRIKVYINDEYVDDFIINEYNQSEQHGVVIPAKFIKEGVDNIYFVACDSWSPSEFGSEDKSSYGFSLNKIELYKHAE